jgi:diguanylate cyclase (GGDEF)-like protein
MRRLEEIGSSPGEIDPAELLGTRTAERWLGYLFLVAGVAGVLNTVVPTYPGFDVPGLLALSAVAFAAGGLLLGARGRCPAWALHGLLVLGNVLIAAAIHFTQGVPNAGALFYLWVSLYAFYFFPVRHAWPHMAGVGLSYAVAIALRPPPFPVVGHWLTTVLAMATAGAFVGRLKGRLDESLARLSQLADTDALTGLANRRGWTARAALEIAHARRSEQSLAVAVIDLDGFKHFNDEQGHPAGDRLLVECAAAWHATIRELDFLARLGGDEFALLLPGCGPGAAAGIAARLQEVMPPAARCSVGVANWRSDETIEQTLARADAALYEAKRGGGGRLVLGEA